MNVISPLNSIMQGQLETSTSLKFLSRRIGKNDALGTDILHGKVSMIFFGPEVLQRQDFRRVLASDVYTEHLRVVVIDEADCISWVTFRDAWSIDKLAQVRAFTPSYDGDHAPLHAGPILEWAQHAPCPHRAPATHHSAALH